MRNLVASILIPFILLFNSNSALSFDFAPEVGDMAPNFQLEGFNKNIKTKTTWELSDFQGKWLVMYFYPKDFTAGCTLEAKGFSELKKEPFSSNSILGYYSYFVYILDLSAISVPTSFYENGMPFGVTIFGKAFEDSKVAFIGESIQRKLSFLPGKESY